MFVKGELPKSCWECPCFRNDLEQGCGLDDEGKDYFLDEIDGGECPLKSLAEHDNDLLTKFADRIKMAFYVEFDEIIPSIMAENIEKIKKEVLDGE